jgi:hypothetical protein
MSTEYEIADDGSQVEIRIRTSAEQEPRVIASLHDCASGTCGCPPTSTTVSNQLT